MAVNKVIFGDEVLIDISDSTVTPENLMENVIAYDAKGEKIIGTNKNSGTGSVTVTDDGNGNVIITGLEITVE